jgi:RNA polymerase sigma-70 factor (ECF subfamily)
MIALANEAPGQLAAERQWVAQALAGDEPAREAIVRKHIGRMLAVARRLLRSEDDAADAAQEAFLTAFQALGRFEGQAALGTWLHRIIVNVCLMKLRTRSRKPEAGLDHLLPSFDESGRHIDRVRSWDEDALSRLSRGEMQATVRTCIDQLPEGHRIILMLRDIEGLDTMETARHLGVRPGAVKTRLHRARQALRSLLEPLVTTVNEE